ncbi:MAG: bacillithiol biosynthesis deacetylase BshB1 [Chitinophagaceae bacterium]
MNLDILAIAAHPDDAELSCAGTLILHKHIGHTTGILDLTEGELGSRGSVETRYQEAAHAKEILNLDYRGNLKLRDGFFEHNEESLLKLITQLRALRPKIVLANAIEDRHPDHGKAAQLIHDACFLSGLSKIETIDSDGNKQTPWRPKKTFHYIQDFYLEPHFIIDISSTMELKMKSVAAYTTQFFIQENENTKTYISANDYIEKVKYRAAMMGKKIGVDYGEGFQLKTQFLGLKNFNDIILPEYV